MHLRCAGLDALLGRKAPRSLSTKTKSRVDEAIRSYGYRAASHVETSTRGRCERQWRLRRLYGCRAAWTRRGRAAAASRAAEIPSGRDNL